MFTARYGLSPYITQIHFVFKGLMVDGILNLYGELFIGLEVNIEESHNNHFS